MAPETELLARDGELQTLVPRANNLETQAAALVIDSTERLVQATDILGMAAKAKKAIEERRKFFVDPLNKQVKAINDWFKSIAAPLERADQTLRGKVLTYNQEQERLRREEEARLRALQQKEHEKQMKKAEKKGLEAPLPPPVVVMPAPLQTVRGDIGKVTSVPTWDFRIVDESQIPREYLAVDEKRIRAVVKAGVRNIPGVEVFQTQTLRVGGR